MVDLSKHLRTLDLVGCSQLVLVQTSGGVQANVYLFEYHSNEWEQVSQKPIASVIGKQGMVEPDQKLEGDMKTPIGLYAIKQAFGTEFIHLNMDFLHITAEDKWVDDVGSPNYNQHVKGECDAKSFENMNRDTYQLGAVIAYNMNPVKPSAGSAIFMHVWESPKTPTAGCVAMAKVDMKNMLIWLEQQKKPHILMMLTNQ